jgi:hypothetical protein
MDSLTNDLSKADVVFYDTNLYLSAPPEFKKKLFTEWYFAGRYYFPFTNQGNYQPVSIYLKNREAADKIYYGSNESLNSKGFKPELRILDNPIYMPVYFKAVLKNENGEIILPKGEYRYASPIRKEVRLEITASTDDAYFDEITNAYFPQRSQIDYSTKDNSILLATSYKEQISTDEIVELGLRSKPNNNPSFQGTISVAYNDKPDNISAVRVAGGYIIKIVFVTDNLHIRVSSAELIDEIHFTKSIQGEIL